MTNNQNNTPNTYLLPITSPYTYIYDYYVLIHANTYSEAYNKAKTLDVIKNYGHTVSQDFNTYIKYNTALNLSKQLFHKSEKPDIIFHTLLNTEGCEHMAYFQINWNDYTKQLSEMAAPEKWSNDTYPDNGILANYLVKTYEKLTHEKNIKIGNNYALFNTGLFTKYYESIFAYQSGMEISFLTDYNLSSIGINERPERANYFENPELLLFDWHYPIDVHYEHILDDKHNKERLPKDFLQSKNKVSIIKGAIDTMKKRISSNYKLAIPQYYDGKMQLLLPLCLLDDNIPDVAIAVTKTDNRYKGHTCLTLDMAYNNARLIAKPESNWLNNNI